MVSGKYGDYFFFRLVVFSRLGCVERSWGRVLGIMIIIYLRVKIFLKLKNREGEFKISGKNIKGLFFILRSKGYRI